MTPEQYAGKIVNAIAHVWARTPESIGNLSYAFDKDLDAFEYHTDGRSYRQTSRDPEEFADVIPDRYVGEYSNITREKDYAIDEFGDVFPEVFDLSGNNSLRSAVNRVLSRGILLSKAGESVKIFRETFKKPGFSILVKGYLTFDSAILRPEGAGAKFEEIIEDAAFDWFDENAASILSGG